MQKQDLILVDVLGTLCCVATSRALAGIVHRDLKSLNLLLDSKWNVKVSDFGLTKFKEDVGKGGGGREVAGSVHWTAPEVLNESPDVDFILADVYSFGIILWELLTREQPYFGLR
jgi:serine/threonine protein kinase